MVLCAYPSHEYAVDTLFIMDTLLECVPVVSSTYGSCISEGGKRCLALVHPLGIIHTSESAHCAILLDTERSIYPSICYV